MIKIENVSVHGFKEAIRGMRNPMNSWEKSDTLFIRSDFTDDIDELNLAEKCGGYMPLIRDNDLDLMKRLAKAGTDHRKFMRMIVVYADVTAPLYWWKEADTYKVGTVRNSCSTMHKITEKEFTLDDFSHDRLLVVEKLETIINWLNEYRDIYVNWDKNRRFGRYLDSNGVELNKKDIWYQIIQLLPSSYNQRATLMLNYEVLANMYHSRKAHKLDEWRDFCKWIETLPYSELITGGVENASNNITE